MQTSTLDSKERH